MATGTVTVVARNRQIIRRQQGLVISKVVIPWYDKQPYGILGIPCHGAPRDCLRPIRCRPCPLPLPRTCSNPGPGAGHPSPLTAVVNRVLAGLCVDRKRPVGIVKERLTFLHIFRPIPITDFNARNDGIGLAAVPDPASVTCSTQPSPQLCGLVLRTASRVLHCRRRYIHTNPEARVCQCCFSLGYVVFC